jgi:hypothetical protein
MNWITGQAMELPPRLVTLRVCDLACGVNWVRAIVEMSADFRALVSATVWVCVCMFWFDVDVGTGFPTPYLAN